MLRRVAAFASLAVVALCGFGTAGAATAPVPTSTASGSFAVTWTRDVPSPSLTTSEHGTVTYTVDDRLRTAGAGQAWIDEPLPDFASAELRRHYGYYLRALARVDDYALTTDAVCEDGTSARSVTTVSSVAQPHALLQAEEPTVSLATHRGSGDVNLPFAVNRDGPIRLGQVVFGTGRVGLRTTGTDCQGANADGFPTATPVDRQDELRIADIMSDAVVGAVDDDFSAFPLTVGLGGATAMHTAPRLTGETNVDLGETYGGSLAIDLRFGGPLRSQFAFCALPSARRMRRVHSLGAAKALLRAYGFPSAPFGGWRPNSAPRGSYYLESGSPTGTCGAPLGTRRYPVLLRSRGITRP